VRSPGWHPPPMGTGEPDADYYERIEALAKAVCSRASDEGSLTFLPEDDDQTPLQNAVNELARNLRYVHQDDDGCLDH